MTTDHPEDRPRSIAEGNTGTKNVKFVVSLNRALTSAVTVNYATANGTATTPADYQARTGTLTFPAGTTSMVVKVPVVGDAVHEPNETFQLKLSGPSTNARLADPVGIATILNND